MFATSTKTATFLPTMTPQLVPGTGAELSTRRPRAARRHAPESAFTPCRREPLRPDQTFDARPRRGEAEALPDRQGRPCGSERRLHDRAALVPRRPEQLLNEDAGHLFLVVARIHDQEIHRTDVAAGLDGRPKGEHRKPGHCAKGFRDEDGGLREKDQLPQQVSGVEGRGRTGSRRGRRPEREHALDVGDACRSNLVFHSAGPRPRALTRPGTYSERSSDGLDREPGVAAPHRGGERASRSAGPRPVSYTHLRAHETRHDL